MVQSSLQSGTISGIFLAFAYVSALHHCCCLTMGVAIWLSALSLANHHCVSSSILSGACLQQYDTISSADIVSHSLNVDSACHCGAPRLFCRGFPSLDLDPFSTGLTFLVLESVKTDVTLWVQHDLDRVFVQLLMLCCLAVSDLSGTSWSLSISETKERHLFGQCLHLDLGHDACMMNA